MNAILTVFLTVEGEVADETVWFVVTGNLQEVQEFVPEFPQLPLLIPGSHWALIFKIRKKNKTQEF